MEVHAIDNTRRPQVQRKRNREKANDNEMVSERTHGLLRLSVPLSIDVFLLCVPGWFGTGDSLNLKAPGLPNG